MKELINKVKSSRIFGFIAFALFFCILFVGESTINYAKVVSFPDETYKKHDSVINKSITYSFNISDKLHGTGAVKLLIKDNKLTGIGNGTGLTCNCKIDFESKMEGEVNPQNGVVSILINGVGDPIKVGIPGKVSYNGPISGKISDNTLKLSGEVDIDGWIATYAGFKDKEELIIEISDPSVVKMLQRAAHNVAFLGL